jgi:hypothetical protein
MLSYLGTNLLPPSSRGKRSSETLLMVYPIIRCHPRKEWYWILSVSASEPEVSTALRTGSRLDAILTELSPFPNNCRANSDLPNQHDSGVTRRGGKRPWSTAKGCHFQFHSRYLLNNPVLRSCCLLHSADLYAVNKRCLRSACENVFMCGLFNYSVTITGCVASNGLVSSEQRIEQNV